MQEIIDCNIIHKSAGGLVYTRYISVMILVIGQAPFESVKGYTTSFPSLVKNNVDTLIRLFSSSLFKCGYKESRLLYLIEANHVLMMLYNEKYLVCRHPYSSEDSQVQNCGVSQIIIVIDLLYANMSSNLLTLYNHTFIPPECALANVYTLGK